MTDIVLVPHTHWDREWYEPFQVFRLRLVAVLDDVIARAEADPGFRFTVDGQMAAVEDYLEVRPENRDRLAALVSNGQIAVGPWQILLDEFLCSGETIVRNLELGWRGASALGAAMPVGYLPDMFGHIAQMPQILARAGIGHACLWRGVPGAVDAHGFRWVAPDGSAVRVEYLWDGYGNALDLFAIPSKLTEAATAYSERARPWYGDDPVLGMVGSDHSAPRPDLMPLARSAGFDVATLAEYVLRRSADGAAPVVEGEMRSHARGNILPGVVSVRVGLKQAMARAERTVGVAEALAGQWSDAAFDRYRELAWRKIVESTAHDSVTGCGVDETAAQVEARLAEADQMGRAVRDRVIRGLAARVPADAHLVVNPLPWARTAVVELDEPAAGGGGAPSGAVLADGSRRPVQVVAQPEGAVTEERLAAEDLALLLRRIHGRELFGQKIETYSVEPGRVTFELAETPTTPSFDKAALRAELEAAAARWRDEWSVRTLAQGRRRVLAAVPVPASGHAAVRLASTEPNGPVTGGVEVAGGTTLDNGGVRVDVADDGTFSLTGADGTTLTGVGRLVDGGDRGDSYNYGPPSEDILVDTPVVVRVAPVENGPVRGTLRVVREYEWPVGLSLDRDSRSVETVRVPVTMDVSVCAGEPFVRLGLSFVNRASDHRLRLHVPLPSPVGTSAAEGQFAVTSRGLTGEGGWGEFPLPTYPASAFVSAGAATVLLDHVTEYELGPAGAELALTLLRAVGWMSVNVHPLRDEPAGSELAVPGAQYLDRTVSARLAVLPVEGGWSAAGAPRLADEFRNGLLGARGTAPSGGDLPDPAPGIAVAGHGVTVPSLRRHGDGIEIRLVAMTGETTQATVTGPFTAARRTDLLGRPLADLPVSNGRLAVDLGPWEIATVHLK